jgi:hypothetical protein
MDDMLRSPQPLRHRLGRAPSLLDEKGGLFTPARVP